MPDQTTVELAGIPETLLLTLYNRAVESQRPRPILRDEQAVRWVEQIDYDFPQFGDGRITHPIRSKVFDDWARRFLARYPNATIFNLGAGLSTMHTRIDNGTAEFVDLDLPEAIDVRRRFIEETDRHRLVAGSALDPAWMDVVEDDKPVFLVAAGLLMYFEPEEVRGLFETLASRFPGAEMAFDVIPTWFSRRTQEGKVGVGDYTFPPCHGRSTFIIFLGWKPGTRVSRWRNDATTRRAFERGGGSSAGSRSSRPCAIAGWQR